MERRRMLEALLGLPFCLAVPAARSEPIAKGRVPSALGYLPWWMAAGWRAVAWNRLDRIVLFDAPIAAEGSLDEREWPSRTDDFAAEAQRAGIAIDLALTLFKPNEFDRMFGDAAARSRLLAACLRALERPFVAGLHLDVEGFGAASPEAIAGFRAWLASLHEAHHGLGKGLSAFFPASDEFAPYDAASAKRLDYCVAQVYDAHWAEGKSTGPLVTRAADNPAAVPRALARLAALGVPREKILLSVPLYGWEWRSESDKPGARAHGKASLLTYADTPESLMPNDRRVATELARAHGLRRDRENTPYYAYRDGPRWVQGWYEDLPSLTRKLAPERAEGYPGLAFFPLGYDKGEIVEGMLRWWRSPAN